MISREIEKQIYLLTSKGVSWQLGKRSAF